MGDDAANTELSFEEAFAQLEEIVARLESGELPLDESVTLFERGQALARMCGAMLDDADLRVQQLRDDGTLDSLT